MIQIDAPFVHNMDPSTLGFDGLHHIQGLLKPGFGSGKLSVPNHSAIGQHVNRHDLLVAGFIDVLDEAQMAG